MVALSAVLILDLGTSHITEKEYSVKKAIISMSVVLLACSATFASASEVGRWQVQQGSYKFVNTRGEEHTINTLLKIDTATGDIYTCEAGQVDGKHVGEPGSMIQYGKCEKFEKRESFPNT